MSTTTTTTTSMEAPIAESRRDRMKQAAVENINTATKATGNAAVAAIAYCHKHKELIGQTGGALGAVGGAAGGSALASKTGCLAAPVVVPATTYAGKKAGEAAAKCVVDGCHNHVAPKIPNCAQAASNCIGKVAERSIDCAADSANACAQGTRDLKDRVSFSCASF
ncbi:MAG: hypothetical protein K1000chlam3_01159 [Chlamydiae bacterium]|nr:hypothetical protein [Chlamydiota bacterium]